MMFLDSLAETKELEAKYIKFYNQIHDLSISDEEKNIRCKAFIEANASKEWLQLREEITEYRNKCLVDADKKGGRVCID